MIHHLNGKLVEKNPAYVVIECNGVGYTVNISLHTFEKLPSQENCKLLIHFLVREDEHKLFGFITSAEREIFRQLLAVSGVGATTAQMMLSSLGPQEVTDAIISEDVNTLKSVKGIGAKTAQRVIIDLKDKLSKISESVEFPSNSHNTSKNEALSALAALGIDRKVAGRAIDKVLKSSAEADLQTVIKQALKNL